MLLNVIIPTKIRERGRIRRAVPISYFWTGNWLKNESTR